jgi:glycosyltransferase involved in cell wall biosynthesis/GT2 family glycosyltransferase
MGPPPRSSSWARMIDPDAPDFGNTPVAPGRARFDYAPARQDAEPVVTIVTGFFNTEPAIFEETVLSVFQQSLQQWEWVIVDDGTTQSDSLAALEDVAARDPRIRVVRHDRNRGLAAARNTGVKHARGSFILQLDSDDLIEPTAAEKWLWFLVSHPEYHFVRGLGVGFGDHDYLWTKGFHSREAFLVENVVAVTSLVRREVFDSVGGYDEGIPLGVEDWEFWLRCAAHGFWGDTIPEYLDWYRRAEGHTDRWGATSGDDRHKRYREIFRRRYPQLWVHGMPPVEQPVYADVGPELEVLPCENTLAKSARRLLFVVPWAAMGGADTFNLDLIAHLRRKDWEITVVTTLHGSHALLPRYTSLTPDVFACSHFLKPSDYPRFLDYVIRSRQPDAILISNSVFAYKALAHLRRAAGDVPIVDFCHMEEEWLNGGYPRLSVDGREFIDLHVTSSQHLKDWEVHRGADPERVEVCYTNVQPRAPAPRLRGELLRALRSGFGDPGDVPLIVYPARLTAQKQPEVFLKTVRALRDGRQRFLALVVGEGPYLPWMEEFVDRHRLGRHVRFLGVRRNSFVREVIAASDVLFLPSAQEGIALSFYEAMAAGVPVVGADVGGQRELVTPDCGVLIRRADEETEVAEYCEVLSGLLVDRGRREAMGKAARARIDAHFTLDKMGDRMEAVFERASDLAVSSRRTVPSAEEAREAAREGVRAVWWDHPLPPSTSPAKVRSVSARSYPRLVLFRAMRAVGMPIYELGIRMGLHWLEPVKDRIFNALFRDSK